ncbi:MAG: alpha/beta fold hydrolase [Clostridia bacterium]|nr:alpha/beta fold hydrolase [Clostridia bacterium]MBQ8893224.1 alpha/beta fold hydrolase [Clostridia bacterium]
MIQQDFTFASPADGTPLEGTYIYPEDPKGIIQFVHGMAEHKARYFGTMTALAEAGYATVIHNHRGHGSCALLGHFGRGGAEGMIADTHAVSCLAKEKFPSLPLTLFGHSMGSLVARCYLKRYDEELNRLFICGTPYAPPAAIRIARAYIALKIKLNGDQHRSTTVNALVTGAFNRGIKNASSPNQWISYDAANVAVYDADPLCGFCFTLSGFQGLMALMAETYSPANWGCKNTALPVHFISGQDDPCHTGEKNFMKAVEIVRKKGYNVSHKLFPAMRHEILLEEKKTDVIKYMLDILENNIQ